MYEGFFSQEGASITPPDVQSVWQWVLVVLLTGGGGVALKQILDAYKNWSETKNNNTKLKTSDHTEAVNSVVRLLESQLSEQAKDYERRLASKEDFYQKEIASRQALTEQTVGELNDTVEKLRQEVSAMRISLQKYERRFGPLPEG